MKQTAAFLVLVSSLVMVDCAKQSPSQTTSSPLNGTSKEQFVLPANYQGVLTAVIGAHPLPDYLEIPAHVEPDPSRVVRVYSPVGGRVIAFRVRPGDRLEKGVTLAVLESSDVSAALAAYAKSKADLHLKQEALERASDLYEHKALALKDLEQAQADYGMSKADLENAGRQLRVLNVGPDTDSDQIRVAAPRSGVVLQVSAAAGEYSKSLDSSDPLCVIADLGTVWAVGDLFEKDLYSVSVGDPAELTFVAFPEQTWKGRVELISSLVDPATRTLKVRVVLRNEGNKLRPDMFGTLRLLRSSHQGLAVPATAVIREGNSNYIFVEQAPGRFERRAVTLGREVEGNQIEVTSGMHSGDKVVIEGTDLLRSATTGQ